MFVCIGVLESIWEGAGREEGCVTEVSMEKVCLLDIPLSLASSAIFCWSLAEIPMMSLGVSPLSRSNCRTYRMIEWVKKRCQ